jgi:hypothetical protein
MRSGAPFNGWSSPADQVAASRGMEQPQSHRFRVCDSCPCSTHRVSRTAATTVSLGVGPCHETARTRKALWSPDHNRLGSDHSDINMGRPPGGETSGEIGTSSDRTGHVLSARRSPDQAPASTPNDPTFRSLSRPQSRIVPVGTEGASH